jgi:hypothetical protein
MLPNADVPFKGCDVCGKTEADTGRKVQLCSRCKARRFCSVDCQKSVWSIHKKECVPPSPTDDEVPVVPRMPFAPPLSQVPIELKVTESGFPLFTPATVILGAYWGAVKSCGDTVCQNQDWEKRCPVVCLEGKYMFPEGITCPHVELRVPPGRCMVCRVPCDKACCGCSGVMYCSDVCARRDMSRHHPICKRQMGYHTHRLSNLGKH